MKRYAERTAEMYGGTVKFEYHRLLDSVINETQSAQLVQSIAINSFGEDSVGDSPPTMGGKILVSTRTILIQCLYEIRNTQHL